MNGKATQIDYAITIDIAKEICMVCGAILRTKTWIKRSTHINIISIIYSTFKGYRHNDESLMLTLNFISG